MDIARDYAQTMNQCPCCHREFADDSKPLTTVAVSVRARVAPGDVVLRTHIADIVQQAVLEWMHESWDALPSTDEMVDLVDIVIAR